MAPGNNIRVVMVDAATFYFSAYISTTLTGLGGNRYLELLLSTPAPPHTSVAFRKHVSNMSSKFQSGESKEKLVEGIVGEFSQIPRFSPQRRGRIWNGEEYSIKLMLVPTHSYTILLGSKLPLKNAHHSSIEILKAVHIPTPLKQRLQNRYYNLLAQ